MQKAISPTLIAEDVVCRDFGHDVPRPVGSKITLSGAGSPGGESAADMLWLSGCSK